MIDTLKISEELVGLGFPPEQAKGLARIQAETISGAAATKSDLAEVELRVRADLEKLRGEFKLLMWVNITAIALGAGPAIKYLLSQ